MKVRLLKVRPRDAKTLALVSRRAFDGDVDYGASGKGGPPGYKSDQWQSKMMRVGMYCKIVSDKDGRIVGGIDF